VRVVRIPVDSQPGQWQGVAGLPGACVRVLGGRDTDAGLPMGVLGPDGSARFTVEAELNGPAASMFAIARSFVPGVMQNFTCQLTSRDGRRFVAGVVWRGSGDWIPVRAMEIAFFDPAALIRVPFSLRDVPAEMAFPTEHDVAGRHGVSTAPGSPTPSGRSVIVSPRPASPPPEQPEQAADQPPEEAGEPKPAGELATGAGSSWFVQR
jgi:hypothetical protein